MHPNHIATNHPNQTGPSGQPIKEPKPNMLGRYLLGAAILIVGGPVAVLCFLIMIFAIAGKPPEGGGKTAASTQATVVDPPEKMFASLKTVCDGNPKAVAIARQSGGNQRYVAFSRLDGKTWTFDSDRLPRDLRAERVEDAANVVCMESETTAHIEDCVFRKRIGVRYKGIPLPSVPTGQVVRFPRTIREMEARVYSADTGRIVDVGFIRASPPTVCDGFVGGSPWASDFAGGSVRESDIAKWLRRDELQKGLGK